MGTATTSYVYDGEGNRFKRTTPNGTTHNARANPIVTFKLNGAAILQHAVNYRKVSIIAIPKNSFTVAPHQPNNFVNPIREMDDLSYSETIQEFNQADRIAVLITNLSGFDPALGPDHPIFYSYHVEVTPP